MTGSLGSAGKTQIRDFAVVESRVRAAIRPPLSLRVYGQQIGPDGDERYNLLLVRVPAAVPPPAGTRCRVLLNGGTHGDEPAGVEAVVRFLEERRYARWPAVDFTLLPCTNPWGYVHDRREGPGGVDLNRSFRRAGRRTPEVSLLKRALGRQRFDLFVDCHEDVDAPGLYVFAPAALGRAIVAAVKAIGPIHPGPDVDGQIPLKESVVELDAPGALERRRSFRQWPLPFYIARYRQRAPVALARGPSSGPAPRSAPACEPDSLTPPDVVLAASATVETPTSLPMAQRVAMHLAAIDAALGTIGAASMGDAPLARTSVAPQGNPATQDRLVRHSRHAAGG